MTNCTFSTLTVLYALGMPLKRPSCSQVGPFSTQLSIGMWQPSRFENYGYNPPSGFTVVENETQRALVICCDPKQKGRPPPSSGPLAWPSCCAAHSWPTSPFLSNSAPPVRPSFTHPFKEVSSEYELLIRPLHVSKLKNIHMLPVLHF